MGRHTLRGRSEIFPLGGSWTLRGYGWRSIWGSKALLLNNELRFPLLDRLVIACRWGTSISAPSAGPSSWTPAMPGPGSSGGGRAAWGPEVRLALGGVLVFRLDAARRTDFESLGNDTRWDFFFGWDF